MNEHLAKKMRFERTSEAGLVESCLLEQFEDGSVYILGDELGELIIEFAPDSLSKAILQLQDLGYCPIALGEVEGPIDG